MQTKMQRTCIVCRNTLDQHDLLRIARVNNEYMLDKFHKLGGRGAYICNNPNCIDKMLNKRLLNRAFKTNLNVSVYENLREQMEK